MSEHGTKEIGDDLRRQARERPHLRDHLRTFKQITGEFPLLIEAASREFESARPNVIYPVGGPIFCHVYGDIGQDTKYYAIEPELEEDEQAVFDRVKDRLLDRSVAKPVPRDPEEFDEQIDELLDESVSIVEADGGSLLGRLRPRLSGRFPVTDRTYEHLRYRLNRDIAGYGPLEPAMRDSANEDIHVIGPHQVMVDHGVYGLLETTIDFGTADEYDNWLRNLGERIGDPVSDADPIVDSTLPDGSRINIIYSDDVSVQGPSLTIRQGDETPLSIFQITKWGTMSPELVAYLWLCLENEQTVFIVGESASGKTTTLNACLTFIPRNSKIYTAEDTAEVRPPHATWQQLLTREPGATGSGGVDMFDLVAAALRSRPDYIIVGEVRGEEGRMAFQAAQTGHPIMLTFHASDIVSMIQRFTSDPINVPETFMDNADVALFQNRVKQNDRVLRRVTSVQEIEGYSKELDGVVTREVFKWDPIDDEVVFRGMNNSYVLEENVASLQGYADPREIYDDLTLRADLVERAIDAGILEYHDVNEFVEDFQRDGIDALPFDVHRAP